MSMLLKIFKVGEYWPNNVDRIRETMLGDGLSVCPITLLFKDHKGWKNTQGKVPPTRQVAGGHVGLNMNLSEMVSDILEPMVGTIQGGTEVISTDDMVANVEEVNKGMEGWNNRKAWKGVVEGNLIVCDYCTGNTCLCEDVGTLKYKIGSNALEKLGIVTMGTKYVVKGEESRLEDEENDLNTELGKLEIGDGGEIPEMMELEEMTIKGEHSGISNTMGMVSNEELIDKFGELRLQFKGEISRKVETSKEVMKRVTSDVLKGLRDRKWKHSKGWDERDLDRKFYSYEVLPELLQDFETEMVLVGSDVVSLYPNLEVEKVVGSIREAVLKSNIKWEEVDYREGVRYLALNWDLEQCKRSNLRRVLPIRRGKRGTRPGLKGAGPRGKLKGDQEQWEFRDIILQEWEKKQIIAEVVSLATRAMFRNHFYKFGGVMYHQTKGGPIGLRGTCAVARLVMQMFDDKWGKILDNLGVTRWLSFRYVDDSRTLLPPIKAGWRWEDGKLAYTRRWELEDGCISGEHRTKEIEGNNGGGGIILGIYGGIWRRIRGGVATNP